MSFINLIAGVRMHFSLVLAEYLLTDISTVAIFIPTVAFLLIRSRLNLQLSIIFIYVLYSLVVDVICYIVAVYFHRYNVFLINSFTFIEGLLLLLFYYSQFTGQFARGCLRIIVLSFLITYVVSTIYQTDVNEMNFITTLFNNVALIFCSIIFLFKLAGSTERKIQDNYLFYFHIGILLYFSMTATIYFLKSMSGWIDDLIMQRGFYQVHDLAHIAFCILITWGVIKWNKLQLNLEKEKQTVNG